MIVRNYELNLLHRLLLAKRVKIETARYVKAKYRSDERENVEYLGGDRVFELDEEAKAKGFYQDGVSYLDIVSEKAFVSIPKNEKEQVFKDVMALELNLEKSAEVFLKNLYGDNYKDHNFDQLEAAEQPIQIKTRNPITPEIKSASKVPNDPSDKLDVGLKQETDLEPIEVRNAAEKAAKMTINAGNKDLLKQKMVQGKNKMQRFQKAMDRRDSANGVKKTNSEPDVDQMYFKR
jgi:hypothetical protein